MDDVTNLTSPATEFVCYFRYIYFICDNLYSDVSLKYRIFSEVLEKYIIYTAYIAYFEYIKYANIVLYFYNISIIHLYNISLSCSIILQFL